MLRNENLFKPKSPEYTVRMLLNKVISEEHKEIPQLKPFSHFTLGCTYADENLKVSNALEKLSDFFKDSVSFSVESIINLGSDTQPLWGVSLSLGKNEEDIRAIFSDQFDSIMCPERNGILYKWKLVEESAKRCPHITIGPRKEDLEIAKKLVELNCAFSFNRIDYKKVGPHDPHVIKSLENQNKKDCSLK